MISLEPRQAVPKNVASLLFCDNRATFLTADCQVKGKREEPDRTFKSLLWGSCVFMNVRMRSWHGY